MYALAFISIFRTCFSIWNLPVKPVPAFKITESSSTFQNAICNPISKSCHVDKILVGSTRLALIDKDLNSRGHILGKQS